MLVGDIVRGNARWHPNKVGIVDDHARHTWRQVNSRLNSLSNALMGLGLEKGDRAAIVCQNRHEVAEFVFAVAKNGVIGVGTNYRLLPEQLAEQINQCQPKAILVEDSFVPKVDSIRSKLDGVKIFVGIGKEHSYPYAYESLVAEYPTEEPRVNIQEDDPHMIVYTSGTTGWVKGALITHTNRMIYIAQLQFGWRVSPDDVFLNVAAAYAIAGQHLLFTACFGGATLVFQPWRGPERWLQTMEKEKVTITTMIPVRYKLLREYLQNANHKYDLSSLRMMPLHMHYPAEEMRETLNLLGVPNVTTSKVFGGTEFGMPLVLSPDDAEVALSPQASEREANRLNSTGKPFLCKVRLVYENGQDVSPGEVGELLLRGDGITKGYWNQPELTEQALAGGWYHTKDLLRQDEDGYFYYAGRKDSMIKSGGFNIYPEEVEAVISKHPAVAEVAVFGVEDEKWGLAVNAAVTLKKRQSATEEEIETHCRQFLSGFQIPKRVHFLDKLPVTESQLKVSVMELRRMFSKSQS